MNYHPKQINRTRLAINRSVRPISPINYNIIILCNFNLNRREEINLVTLVRPGSIHNQHSINMYRLYLKKIIIKIKRNQFCKHEICVNKLIAWIVAILMFFCLFICSSPWKANRRRIIQWLRSEEEYGSIYEQLVLY